MAITVKRGARERRELGVITFPFSGADVGKTLDFMGVLTGFRVIDVNVTIDTAFANADNKVSVGIEGNLTRFMDQTTINAVKGIPFNNRQLTASKTMSIVLDVVGTASATGEGTVTVVYAKLATSKQEY